MNKPTSLRLALPLAVAVALVLLLLAPARADTYGSGANTFTIDFVTVGDPGNADDSGTTGGLQFALRRSELHVSDGRV